jgi:hypothetical protein
MPSWKGPDGLKAGLPVGVGSSFWFSPPNVATSPPANS